MPVPECDIHFAAHTPVSAGSAQRAKQVGVDKQGGWVPLGVLFSPLCRWVSVSPRFLNTSAGV